MSETPQIGLFQNSVIKESVSLSELAGKIKQALNKHLQPKQIWVAGEVRDLRYNLLKNQYYFKLVETNTEGAVVASFMATIWGNNSGSVERFQRETGQKLTDKLMVRVLCEVSFHAQYNLSLNILDIDPFFTIGNLEVHRQKMLNKLESSVPGVSRDGATWFTPNKLLRWPLAIRNIIVLSARNSDGLRDFVHELEHNENKFKFNLVHEPVQVQGKGSAQSIIDALEKIRNLETDLVVIVRGGGGDLDLLSFDSFDLGRVIATYPIPVLVGVGHERNNSVADLMANQSVKTPTKAANFIVAHNAVIYQAILTAKDRSIELLYHKLNGLQHHVVNLVLRAQLLTNNKRQALLNQISFLNSQVKLFTRLKITDTRAKIEMLVKRAQAADPRIILSRGYYLLERNNTRLRDIYHLESGTIITIVGGNQKREATLS